MKKNKKNLNAGPQVLDDDVLKNVYGGVTTVRSDGSIDLWGDGNGEHQGNFHSIDSAKSVAKAMGTSMELVATGDFDANEKLDANYLKR